jgi:hypothetical protein
VLITTIGKGPKAVGLGEPNDKELTIAQNIVAYFSKGPKTSLTIKKPHIQGEVSVIIEKNAEMDVQKYKID